MHPNHGKSRVIICIDNQAAIRAVENPGNSSGQHLIKSIIIFIEKSAATERRWSYIGYPPT